MRSVLSATIVVLFLAACGGGGGGGPDGSGGVESVPLADIMSSMESSLQDVDGDEFGVPPVSGGDFALNYTFEFYGFAFCAPSNPYAAQNPVNSETPDLSLYGCYNNVDLTWQLDSESDPTAVEVTVSAASMFLDFGGGYSVLGIPGSFDGYQDVDQLTMTFTLGLADNGDGTYTLSNDLMNYSVLLGGIDTTVDNAVLNVLLGLFEGYLGDITRSVFDDLGQAITTAEILPEGIVVTL